MVTWYALWSTVISLAVHIALILILTNWLDMGYQGVVIATSSQFMVRFLVMFLLTELRDDVRKFDDVHLFSKETITNLKPLVSKSFAALLLGVWAWWAFDILTLMATYRGSAEASAQIILRSVGMFTFMIPFGLAGGCNILFGKYIGRKNVAIAMHYYRVSQLIACIAASIQIMILVLGKDLVIKFFTSDPEIAAEISSAWLVSLLFTIFEAIQIVSGTFIRGTGKQCGGAFLTTSAYLVLGIPSAWYMTFYRDMGIVGLWYGQMLSCIFLCVAYNIFIVCIDWEKLFVEIEERRIVEN